MQRRQFIQTLGIALAGAGLTSVVRASPPDNPPPRLQPLSVERQLVGKYLYRDLKLLDEIRVELKPDPYMPDGIQFYRGDDGFVLSHNDPVIASLIRQGKTVRGAITSLSKREGYFDDGTDMGLGNVEFMIWVEG